MPLQGLLPPSILHRKKRGFGAPFGRWLKGELAPLLHYLLSKDSVTRRGLLDWEVIQETITAHNSAKADLTDHLLSLITLEIWARIYIDGQEPDCLSKELGGVVSP